MSATSPDLNALRQAFVKGACREPWEHQLHAAANVLKVLSGSAGHGHHGHGNCLVQHSTGSGKSLTMALLAWALRCSGNNANYALVLILSDRIQLDRQLGDACTSFLQQNDVPVEEIWRCDDHGGHDLLKVMGDVAASFCSGCRVVISTKQRFDWLCHGSSADAYGMLLPILQQGRVVVICEEAHRSHLIGGRTSAVVNRLFGSHCFHGVAARAGLQPRRLSYVGFTATPDERTLKFFSRRCELGSSLHIWRPVHTYHIGQAERDGVILNVLVNYTRVPQPDGDMISKAAWLWSDFADKCSHLPEKFQHECVAMVVCRSRVDVFRWVEALRSPDARLDLPSACKDSEVVFGFFSGVLGEGYPDEVKLNCGMCLLDACAQARIIVVCNKLETGYDNPKLCAMYIDRKFEGPKQMVQVLSRVNRRAEGKSAFIVDFRNEPQHIFAAFDGFRSETVACNDPEKADAAACLETVLERFGSLLQGNSNPQISFGAVQQDRQEYLRLSEELGLSRTRRADDFLDAVMRAVYNGDMNANASVATKAKGLDNAFVEQHAANRSLLRVTPSSRYHGQEHQKMRPPSYLSFQPVAKLETSFQLSMRPLKDGAPKATLPIVRHTLISPGSAIQASLCGTLAAIDVLFSASEKYAPYFNMAKNLRSADASVPYPIFLCSKGRAEIGLLRWDSPHCLGTSAPLVPLVIVVEPQEESMYRAAWPDALLLVLSRPAETVIGYTRWVVQKICTYSQDSTTGRVLQLPFIWMADDLLVLFFKIEKPLGSDSCQILRALVDRGFREAFLAVQRHPLICRMAVAGFLRDRGFSCAIRRPWLLDGSLAMQKIVLLNLAQLTELGVEYCPQLRKSEDLALCYDVMQRQGGHVLKAQCYCYRALVLQSGGAKEVRAECRSASSMQLVRSGDLGHLTAAHRAALEAIEEWERVPRKLRSTPDVHIDIPDGVLSHTSVMEALMSIPWPDCTSRANVTPCGASSIKAMCLGLVRTRVGKYTCSSATSWYPNIARLVVRLAALYIPEFKFTSVQLNLNYSAKLHVDSNNCGPSCIVGLGNYEGGELWVMDSSGDETLLVTEKLFGFPQLHPGNEVAGKTHDIKEKWFEFNGCLPHCALPFAQGSTRISIVYFSRKGCLEIPEEVRQKLIELRFPLPDAEWLSLHLGPSNLAITRSSNKKKAGVAQARKRSADSRSDEAIAANHIQERLRASVSETAHDPIVTGDGHSASSSDEEDEKENISEDISKHSANAMDTYVAVAEGVKKCRTSTKAKAEQDRKTAVHVGRYIDAGKAIETKHIPESLRTSASEAARIPIETSDSQLDSSSDDGDEDDKSEDMLNHAAHAMDSCVAEAENAASWLWSKLVTERKKAATKNSHSKIIAASNELSSARDRRKKREGTNRINTRRVKARLWHGSRKTAAKPRATVRYGVAVGAKRCLARIWAQGLSSQCSKKRCIGCGAFCSQHWKSSWARSDGVPVHGRIDGPVPKDKVNCFSEIAFSSIAEGAPNDFDTDDDGIPPSIDGCHTPSAMDSCQTPCTDDSARQSIDECMTPRSQEFCDDSDGCETPLDPAETCVLEAPCHDTIQSWISCDRCGQWHIVSETFMLAHAMDDFFSCTDLGKCCSEQHKLIFQGSSSRR